MKIPQTTYILVKDTIFLWENKGVKNKAAFPQQKYKLYSQRTTTNIPFKQNYAYAINPKPQINKDKLPNSY